MQEKEDEAVADVRHALALWQGALRPDHPSIGLGHANLSAVLASTGRPHEALEELLKARAIAKRAHEEDHRRIAMLYNNEGNLHRRLGDHERALEAFLVSLERTERALGPGHPEVALVANNLCMTLQDLERPADAERYCERAVDLYDAQPAETLWRAQSHYELSRTLVASGGNRHRALALARRSRSEYAELDDAEWVSKLDAWIAELERRSDSGS